MSDLNVNTLTPYNPIDNYDTLETKRSIRSEYLYFSGKQLPSQTDPKIQIDIKLVNFTQEQLSEFHSFKTVTYREAIARPANHNDKPFPTAIINLIASYLSLNDLFRFVMTIRHWDEDLLLETLCTNYIYLKDYEACHDFGLNFKELLNEIERSSWILQTNFLANIIKIQTPPEAFNKCIPHSKYAPNFETRSKSFKASELSEHLNDGYKINAREIFIKGDDPETAFNLLDIYKNGDIFEKIVANQLSLGANEVPLSLEDQLSHLKVLELNNTTVSNQLLFTLLKVAKKLESFDFVQSKIDQKSSYIDIEAGGIPSLKSIFIRKSKLSFGHLRRILSASPVIESLSLIECPEINLGSLTNLHGRRLIQKGSLEKLKNLDTRDSQLSYDDIEILVEAAKNPKELTGNLEYVFRDDYNAGANGVRYYKP